MPAPNPAPKQGSRSGKLMLAAVAISACYLLFKPDGHDRASSGSSPVGSSTYSPGGTGQPDEFSLRMAAEELVRRKLRDPSSAEFSGERVKVGTGGRSSIVCGQVNSRNGFGGMTGAQRFIVGGTVILEEEIDPGVMDPLWAQQCA